MTTTDKWPRLIRKIRDINRWSQEQLSEVMGTDQASISRWERGQIQPGMLAQEKLEVLAQEVGLQSLSGIELLVKASPFPMMLVSQERMVIAASASSGFTVGLSVVDQTPQAERDNLNAFHAYLTSGGFWSLGETLNVEPLKYSFVSGMQMAGAVVVPIIVRGEVYALVQKA